MSARNTFHVSKIRLIPLPPDNAVSALEKLCILSVQTHHLIISIAKEGITSSCFIRCAIIETASATRFGSQIAREKQSGSERERNRTEARFSGYDM